MNQCVYNVWEMLYCGIDVNDAGGDYADLSIDYLGLVEFPRHIDSQTKCWNPYECAGLCYQLRREGRAPPTCTYCNTQCPSNFFEGIKEITLAIKHDVWEAMTLAMQCLEHGIGGCICAGALMLRPKWLDPTDYRYTPKQKCYVGDPLEQIIDQIGEMLESSIGGSFSSFFGSIFDGFNPSPDGAQAAQAEHAARQWCRTSNRFGHGAADQCYYKRVSAETQTL